MCIRVDRYERAHDLKNVSKSTLLPEAPRSPVSSSSSTGAVISLAEMRVLLAFSEFCTHCRSSAGHGSDIFQSPAVASKDNGASFASSPSIASSLYKQ